MNHHDLVAKSMEELRLKTATHHRLWRLGDADWSVDQDSANIVFSAPGGMVATCTVQIIGTFDTNDSTWLWAWDHPSVQPALREHAERLRQYGQANGISELTTRKLSVNEDQCWEFTALACKLNEAQGAYRGPTGLTLVFVTFGTPRLTGSIENDVDWSGAFVHDAANEFTSDIPPDVQSTLTGFIKALYDWEVAAYEASERDESSATMQIAQENYNTLIRRWCVADLTPQPVSFGSHPSHGPDTERIISACQLENRCRVRTQHTDSTGFVSDYEYHLRIESDKWLIENLFYVDEHERFEML